MILRSVTRHPMWSVFALALAIRVAFVALARLDPYAMVDSTEYDLIARGLLAGEGYITGPNLFFRPPVYPIVVAACYVLGGLVTLQGVQIVLSAASAVIVGDIARRLHRDPSAGPVAGAAAAVYPWLFAYVGGLASETVFIFLWVGAVALLLRAVERRELRVAIGAGAVFGLAALTRANLLVLAPALALWMWWRTRGLGRPLGFGLAAVAVLMPFAAYHLVLGNGLVISSNGGGESFYIGNNPGQTALYAGTLPESSVAAETFIGPLAQAYIDCPALRCIYDIPMAQRDAFFYRAGLRYIAEHPGDALLTDLRKLVHYWRPWVDPRVYPWPVVIVTGISFSALLVLTLLALGRMPRDSAALVLAIALVGTLTVVLWHVQLRYRFAVLDPILLAAAAGPVARWLQRTQTPPVATARARILAVRRAS